MKCEPPLYYVVIYPPSFKFPPTSTHLPVRSVVRLDCRQHHGGRRQTALRDRHSRRWENPIQAWGFIRMRYPHATAYCMHSGFRGGDQDRLSMLHLKSAFGIHRRRMHKDEQIRSEVFRRMNFMDSEPSVILPREWSFFYFIASFSFLLLRRADTCTKSKPQITNW